MFNLVKTLNFAAGLWTLYWIYCSGKRFYNKICPTKFVEFTLLPEDLLYVCLKFLDVGTCRSLALTNKKFARILRERIYTIKDYWKWKTLEPEDSYNFKYFGKTLHCIKCSRIMSYGSYVNELSEIRTTRCITEKVPSFKCLLNTEHNSSLLFGLYCIDSNRNLLTRYICYPYTITESIYNLKENPDMLTEYPLRKIYNFYINDYKPFITKTTDMTNTTFAAFQGSPKNIIFEISFIFDQNKLKFTIDSNSTFVDCSTDLKTVKIYPMVIMEKGINVTILQ